ncbi:MAG: ribulose-phosphate 3-epimerase [Actinobacteria bacterium]|uniref:ribulose-phosphate 3-epimerase n=2 Tax=freshwater metagenome TaxID=449393 RepID=A0A6J6R5G1_9ZZZZ|nr:ribulose-phosphate 3-epimerase [Actinomycetota bacterium]MTA23231.1 ribulose-phosphate 3-epimerase [Actinomycetota bacterium]
MSSVRICPSILNADRQNLFSEILRIASVSDLLHLDVMDNKFVPNFTFSFEEAVHIIEQSPLAVDSHLMIADPDIQAPLYAEHGSASVTFHLEAASDVKSLISNIASNGARVGIAIKPGTPFSSVEPFMADIDMLLVMTVEPGFGGQKFMSDMMPKVAAARSWILANQLNDLWLQVDGGISLATINEATLSGADTFVAGSAVFNSPEPAVMVRDIRLAAEKCRTA